MSDLGQIIVVPFMSGPSSAGWTFDQAKAVTSSAGMVYTFANFNTGVAAANRVVVAGLVWNHSIASSFVSMTIGGVPATLRMSAVALFQGKIVVCDAVVPAGVTADVVVTYDTNPTYGMMCMVWHGRPATPTPLDVFGVSADSGALVTAENVQTVAGGIVIGVAGDGTPSHPWTWGWNGADTVVSLAGGTNNLIGYSAAHVLTTVAGTTNDMTADPSSTNTSALVVVSYGSTVANPQVTSYANTGGTGNRSGIITIVGTMTPQGTGLHTDFIDGTQVDEYWWAAGQVNRTMTFDFGVGASKVIDEFKYYQNAAATQGTWQLQGSNDNSTYTTFPESFNLGGLAATQTIPVTNSTGYRYYRLTQIAGSTTNSPYIREIEFKIRDA